MSRSYIPKSDAGFRDWLANMARLVSEQPGRFGLDAADAKVIANLNETYDKAYRRAKSPATRTPNAVAHKDAVRASAEASVRVYAMLIKANAAVDNDSRIAVGLRPGPPSRTPIPAPSSAPILSIVAAFPGEHVLRYADENAPASRAKPPGVTQLDLHVAIAPGQATSHDDADFAGIYTRQPIRYAYRPDDTGLTATFFARWRTARGLSGPWSLPVSMTIAAAAPGREGPSREYLSGGAMPHRAA